MTATNNATALATNQPYVPLTIYPLTDTSLTRCPPDHRLCEIGWRLTEKQKDAGYKKRSDVCIPIPTIKLTINPTELSETIQACFEDMQDKMIAAWLNKLLSANTSYNYLGTRLPLTYTTPFGITDLYEKEEKRGKISADTVRKWFDDCLAARIVEKLVEKNADIETAEAEAKVKRYKDIIASLTSHSTVLQIPQAKIVQSVVDLAEDGQVKIKLTSMLKKFIEPAKWEDEMLELV